MNTQHTQDAVIGGMEYKVDTFEAPSTENVSTVAFHFFNDGEGFSIGLYDPRLSTELNASVVLSRADAVALYAWLREHGGFDHE